MKWTPFRHFAASLAVGLILGLLWPTRAAQPASGDAPAGAPSSGGPLPVSSERRARDGVIRATHAATRPAPTDPRPLHGEWAPETSPERFPVERLMPPGGGIPPSQQVRPAVIAVGPFRIDNSHPKYTTVPYEATRSGLQAALQERAAQVQACVEASGMDPDAPVTYVAKIWPDMPWHDVMEVVASTESLETMTEDERARTRDFNHCVHWALSSAEFARTPDDEFVEIELPLPGPRLTPAHQAAVPAPKAWVEEARQNWQRAYEEASKKK